MVYSLKFIFQIQTLRSKSSFVVFADFLKIEVAVVILSKIASDDIKTTKEVQKMIHPSSRRFGNISYSFLINTSRLVLSAVRYEMNISQRRFSNTCPNYVRKNG